MTDKLRSYMDRDVRMTRPRRVFDIMPEGFDDSFRHAATAYKYSSKYNKFPDSKFRVSEKELALHIALETQRAKEVSTARLSRTFFATGDVKPAAWKEPIKKTKQRVVTDKAHGRKYTLLDVGDLSHQLYQKYADTSSGISLNGWARLHGLNFAKESTAPLKTRSSVKGTASGRLLGTTEAKISKDRHEMNASKGKSTKASKSATLLQQDRSQGATKAANGKSAKAAKSTVPLVREHQAPAETPKRRRSQSPQPATESLRAPGGRTL